MKKVRILILAAVAVMLFSSCSQKIATQKEASKNTSKSTVQASSTIEDQSKEISSLKQRVNELEKELQQKENELDTELQQRVGKLENYFDRRTPEAVAKLYVDALKTRNGAVLYALYSKELKAENHDFFVSIGWHLGVSNSPQIESFTLGKPIKSEDGQTTLKIIFHYTPRDGVTSDETCTLTLKQTQKDTNEDWYITAFKYDPK